MKRNALVVLGLLVTLAPASAVLGKNVSQNNNFSIVKTAKITVEQARKAALKKVDGTVEDEYTIEDDDEKVATYVFIIKAKTGKTFEVQIDANNGNVLSSDEMTEEMDDEEETPAIIETDSDDIEVPIETTEDTTSEEEPPMFIQ